MSIERDNCMKVAPMQQKINPHQTIRSNFEAPANVSSIEFRGALAVCRSWVCLIVSI